MSGELPRAVLDEIYAHAKAGYPEEVCGLILAGEEVRRCENRQNALHAEDPVNFPRNAGTAYNFAPKDLMFLDRFLRSGRPAIIYHSHVNVGAYFSEEDVRAAAPDGELLYPVDYLVIDAAAPDRVGGCKLFRFSDGKFNEIASYDP